MPEFDSVTTMATTKSEPLGQMPAFPNPDHWSVVDGVHAAPTAQITVSDERTVAVLSRGVSYDEARDSITIGGDEAVARGWLDVVTPLLGRPDG